MANRILIVWLLAVGLTACGASAIPLVNGPQTPAAEGRITTDDGSNGNLKLAIEVKHLALPEKVSPGATLYTVWVQPAGAPPQNIGALRVDAERPQAVGDAVGVRVALRPAEAAVTADQCRAARAPSPVVGDDVGQQQRRGVVRAAHANPSGRAGRRAPLS